MLNELSQTQKTNLVWSHLKKHRNRTDWKSLKVGDGEMGEMGEGSLKVQTFSYKISHLDVMSSLVTMQSGDYS